MFGVDINYNSLNRQLYLAAGDAEDASQAAKVYLEGNALTHLWIWIQMEVGVMPQWAENQIIATKKLEDAIVNCQKVGIEIPDDVSQDLSECREIVREISDKVDAVAFNELMKIDRQVVQGSSGLLSGARPSDKIAEHEFEWHVNFGLMMLAYRRAQSPELKKEINFLILNYLAKAAPISFERLEHVLGNQKGMRESQDKFNLGYFVDHGYHREKSVFTDLFRVKLLKDYAHTLAEQFLFTLDTTKIEHLFPVKFHLVPLLKKEAVSQIKEIVLKHFQDHLEDHFDTVLQKQILFDLTAVLSEWMVTCGEMDKQLEFDVKVAEVKSFLNDVIGEVVKEITSENPKILKTVESENSLVDFIKENILAVSFSSHKGIDAIVPIPVLGRSPVDLGNFLNLTGLRMGGVSSRMKIHELFTLDELLGGTDLKMAEYSVPGVQDVIYYPQFDQVTETHVFRRFEEHMSSVLSVDGYSAYGILGKTTVDLIQGLRNEITDEAWLALNRDPVDLEDPQKSDHLARRMILQTSLFRLLQGLAEAESSTHDFIKFTNAIELVHCEIATLLELTLPFQADDFQDIYKQQLSFVPADFQDTIIAGVTKSAMNTFAGVCSAVMSTVKDSQFAHGQDSYFEQVYVVGENTRIDKIFKDPAITKVDLYIGEFNHNINPNRDYHHYTAGSVIEDVEKLLKNKKSEHLTVALDSTIDLVNSRKAKELLTRFHDEIERGELNLIIFRSGQKFEMLGMDNYYGSPFYMVNNGKAQWDAFKALRTEEAYQTDPLSIQWFCLVNKYAPSMLDLYRSAIISNSRNLLDRVPEELKSAGSPLRISTVDSEMSPAFLDLKIVDLRYIDKYIVEEIFYKKMIAEGRKVHSRGSFGFYHPNFNFIDATTLRINPGLDPKDNEIIVEVLKEIVREIQKKQI